MKIVKETKCYNYKTLTNDLRYLQFEYPIFEIKSIGKTILGKNIFCVTLGKGPKKIMINASHHANEWITTLILMMFMENYMSLYTKKENRKGYQIAELWERASLYLVPMVNPDGVDLVLGDKTTQNEPSYQSIWKPYQDQLNRWKANLRGVDLNLNYPAGWDMARKNKGKKGVIKPGPRDYVGPNPLSELETRAMCRLTMLHRFDMTISLHSQGEEIYWNYHGYQNQRAYEIGKLFEKVSGYQLTTPAATSSFAGYKDWFIQEYHKPGYTIEMGKGEEEISLPLSQAKQIYEQVEEIFWVALAEV